MTTRLDPAVVQTHLNALPQWQLKGQIIETTRTFADFPTAIAFVNQLVAPAEQAGHHPDLLISYNQVTIQLTTHDAGGLTAADFALAQVIDQLHPPTSP